MKKIFLLFGLLLSFPFIVMGGDGAVSGVYRVLHNDIPEQGVAHVAKIIGLEASELQNFLDSEQFGDAILEICQTKEEKKGTMEKSAIHECLKNIQKMVSRERFYLRRRTLSEERTNSFSRFWDGRLSNSSDYDIFIDIDIIDQQFFGKFASIVLTPISSLSDRNASSLSKSKYRLSDNAFRFSKGNSCDSDEASLYGGIVCRQKFCPDFLCVNVKAIPGRKPSISTGTSHKASLENVILGLSAVAERLRRTTGLTPTENENAVGAGVNIWEWDQITPLSITFVPKVPPILAELGAKKGDLQSTSYSAKKDASGNYTFEQQRATPKKSEGSQNGTKTTKDTNKKKKENKKKDSKNDHAPSSKEILQNQIWTELGKSRKKLHLCAGNSNCTSADELTFFEDRCALLATQTEIDVRSCVQNIDAELKAFLEKNNDELELILLESKRAFLRDVPNELRPLWGAISSFEGALDNISKCQLEQALGRCGTEKKTCGTL